MINLNIDPSDYGYIRADSGPNETALYDWMEGVVEALYTSGNLKDLEHCLEEACAEINMKIPLGEMKVKPKELNLQYHLGYQRGVIDSMSDRAL